MIIGRNIHLDRIYLSSKKNNSLLCPNRTAKNLVASAFSMGALGLNQMLQAGLGISARDPATEVRHGMKRVNRKAQARDMSLLESALHRPQNLAAYGTADIADLAAAYTYGISRNHAFLDGNKRTAFVVAYVFLLDQKYELIASNQEAVAAMLAVAAGEMPEAELAAWFRGYIRPI